MPERLLVATRNPGKVAEFADMLEGLNLTWMDLDQAGISLRVAETGTTFMENANIKAVAYATASGVLTLADDSGLEVDALGGKPGVHTARFGGDHLLPQERYELLLRRLKDVPWEKRTARFRCVISIARPEGILGTAEGTCEGFIALSPAGKKGFGYDPVFFLPERNRTMAQLTADEKHAVSHRGRAVAAIAQLLREVVRL